MPFKKQPPLYHVWMSMKDRCYRKTSRAYKDYGARGITVCERWLNSYKAFESDMLPRQKGTSIERIDNNGSYSPENCKWATKTEQQRNRRVVRDVLIEGKVYKAVELSELSGIKTDAIIQRASLGLSYEEVISPEKRVFHEGLALGGIANGKRQRARKHCSKGHKFTKANTRITPEGWRNCRACHAAKMRRRNAAKKI